MSSEIWVIEDDALVSKWLSDTLGSEGFAVRVFDRAYPALEALGDAPGLPSGILVDHILPDLLGAELCGRIRTLPALDKVPLVLMSARNNSELLAAEAKQKYGCKAFLPKPLVMEEVKAVLQSLMSAAPGTLRSNPAEPQALTLVTPPQFSEAGAVGENGFDVARILAHLVGSAFTGRLELKHSEVMHQVWFDRGQIVSASSSAPLEQLSTFLKQKKILTPEQMKDVETISHGKQSDLVNTLVQLGLIPPHQLFEVITEQVRTLILSTFSWSEGNYSIHRLAALPADVMRLNLSFHEILCSGLEMAYDEDALHEKFLHSKIMTGPDFSQKIGNLRLGPRESKMLHALHSPASIDEILEKSDLPALEALQVLYAVDCVGGLQHMT